MSAVFQTVLNCTIPALPIPIPILGVLIAQ